jgi:hypothetical protein
VWVYVVGIQPDDKHANDTLVHPKTDDKRTNDTLVHTQPDDKRTNDTHIGCDGGAFIRPLRHVVTNLIIIDYHQFFIFILG